MEKLRLYLNGLTRAEQDAFAARCRTTAGYLRKAISAGQKLAVPLAVRIEAESAGAVLAEDVRPDLHETWEHLRANPPRAQEAAA